MRQDDTRDARHRAPDDDRIAVKGLHVADAGQRMATIGVGMPEEVDRPVVTRAMEAEAADAAKASTRMVRKVRDRAGVRLSVEGA